MCIGGESVVRLSALPNAVAVALLRISQASPTAEPRQNYTSPDESRPAFAPLRVRSNRCSTENHATDALGGCLRQGR